MHKDELLKLQQSNAKFIVIGSSQDKSKTPQQSKTGLPPSTSKQPAAIQPAQLSMQQMPVTSSQQSKELKQPTVKDAVSAMKPPPSPQQQNKPQVKKENLQEKRKQKQQPKQQQKEQKKHQQKPEEQQLQQTEEQQQQMDCEPPSTRPKEADVVETTTSTVKEVDIMLCFVCLEERY